MGIPATPTAMTPTPTVFQSQVAILGWGYRVMSASSAMGDWFQSQVAILGWGYLRIRLYVGCARDVSIAGGDSWVGIPKANNSTHENTPWFQSQVAILGWGYRFVAVLRDHEPEFQSQVAILGWGYGRF